MTDEKRLDDVVDYIESRFGRLDILVKDAGIKRFVTADEIVCPILILASEASGYMTGSELVVDGGMTVR